MTQPPTPRRVHRIRRFVAIFKLVTGTAELATGIGVLLLTSTGLRSFVEHLLEHERRQDPNDIVVRFVEHHLSGLVDRKQAIGLTLVVLGVIKLIGAIGLLLHKPWALYLLIGSLAVLLPADAVHLIHHPNGFSIALGAANVVLLALLLVYRKPLAAREEGS